jgi:G3E family GTPase
MKLIIFSGFLGAGKTVAITSLARYLSAGGAGTGTAAGTSTKAVIIENEIGDVSFDKSILRSEGHEVLNLMAGCICCSLSGDLLTTLRETVPWYNPDYVIFEPTGLAFPEKILEVIESEENIEWIRTVTVVDANRYKRLADQTPLLIEAQIKNADTILINKIDLVDESELREVKESVRGINPDAEVVSLSANDGVPDEVWEKVIS